MGADGRSLVVIGASAGGVEALSRLVADLPGDLPAAVVVVLHVPPSPTSLLAHILNRRGTLPAAAAAHRDRLRPGRIYVAPPDHHVRVEGDTLVLDQGPKENGHRPAIDPLFASAARALGPAVVGVILSGTLDDGSAGLGAIKLRGGTAVVQDPDDALYRGMPAHAIERVDVDHVVPLADMARLLADLVMREPGPPAEPADPRPRDLGSAPGGELDAGAAMREDEAAGLSCPECGGSLWHVGKGAMQRFRCRIGHAYSEQSLIQEQGKSIEIALWTALRALEERAALLRRMARRARQAGHGGTAARFDEQADVVDGRAAAIREHIVPPALESGGEAAAQA